MAALVFDSGALIALERGDRKVAALLVAAVAGGAEAITSCVCVAEVWRDPARQARLTRALCGFRERSLDPKQARACGALLAKAGVSDVADAALCQLARHGDTVVTSDPSDIARLLQASGIRAGVHAV
ncbi:MAG TPA: PIN domain-containing protein [Solirubrobacteraceae bacterium]|jgi:predicted nucleic acid-binding protein|nr:PIN domain-containing protein [Solirubrobacteraceae bacterium]